MIPVGHRQLGGRFLSAGALHCSSVHEAEVATDGGGGGGGNALRKKK